MLNRNPSQNGLSVDHDPEDEGSGQTPVEPAAPAADAGQVLPQVPKREAVRLALAAGRDTTKDGVAWIKQELKLDINDATFNTYKSNLKHKAKKDEDLETLSDILKRGDVNLLDAMKAVKELVKLCGGDMVKGMVDLFDS